VSPSDYTEDTLVQQTTAEYLEKELHVNQFDRVITAAGVLRD